MIAALLAPASTTAAAGHLQRAWQTSVDPADAFTLLTLGSILLQTAVYLACSLPPFIFQFMHGMQRFRLQNKRQPTLAEQLACLRRVLIFKLFIYYPLLLLLAWTLRWLEWSIPVSWSSMPPWPSLLARLLFCMLCEDTMHYWAHRALHHRWLYARLHKQHHVHTTPFALAAESAHPIESVILGVGFFVPLLLVCNHLAVGWLWLIVRTMHAADMHSGFAFPFCNPLNMLPGYIGSRFHDFHHQHGAACFASAFTFWDTVCGTDEPFRRTEAIRRRGVVRAREAQRQGQPTTADSRAATSQQPIDRETAAPAARQRTHVASAQFH